MLAGASVIFCSKPAAVTTMVSKSTAPASGAGAGAAKAGEDRSRARVQASGDRRGTVCAGAAGSGVMWVVGVEAVGRDLVLGGRRLAVPGAAVIGGRRRPAARGRAARCGPHRQARPRRPSPATPTGVAT